MCRDRLTFDGDKKILRKKRYHFNKKKHYYCSATCATLCEL